MDRRTLMAAVVGLGAGLGLTGFRAGPGSDGHADAPIPALPADLTARLEALTRDSRSVGGMVAAAREGRLVGFHAWGDARRSPSRPVTPETLFHIGSNGKFVTAVAVMQLVQAGRLTLADPLGRHVPGLPPILAETRIDHLLHQTSGLPDYLDQVEDWSLPVTRDMVFEAVAAGRNFEPGEAWAYSNTNYFVLGWLIEALSGLSYGEYISARIFRPAGLPYARADSSIDDIPARAAGYSLDGDHLAEADAMEDEMSRAADGGVLFSARDLAPWAAVLTDDGLLPGATRTPLFTPALLTTGRTVPYGGGVFLEQCRRAALHHHSGGVPGLSSYRMAFAGSGLTLLAATNTDGDARVPLQSLCLTMAEGLAPNSTFTTLPLLPADARTGLLRAAFTGGRVALPDGLAAPELLASGGVVPAAAIAADHVFAPVERWQVAGGDMVRYRWIRSDRTGHIVIGWTPDDTIFWIA